MAALSEKEVPYPISYKQDLNLKVEKKVNEIYIKSQTFRREVVEIKIMPAGQKKLKTFKVVEAWKGDILYDSDLYIEAKSKAEAIKKVGLSLECQEYTNNCTNGHEHPYNYDDKEDCHIVVKEIKKKPGQKRSPKTKT